MKAAKLCLEVQFFGMKMRRCIVNTNQRLTANIPEDDVHSIVDIQKMD